MVPCAVVLGYTFAGCFASSRQEWAGLHLDPETVADPASAVKSEGKYSSKFLLIPFYQPGLQPGTICLHGGEEECCHRSCEGLGVLMHSRSTEPLPLPKTCKCLPAPV